ncbi:hypothetical protein D9611_005076 [Ephemerocybe angulata]|uniref:Tubulin-specific chaperone A n=1 Tax=Ephemerocybe angulata TaxID=980116 RepID=A0A8H5C0S7_9AGAR|nr:hypothetical protein D9611_005076 [Tulosesus angulatus]
MDTPAIKRQLKIKTGALQRLLKENGLYAKEIGDLEIRREKFIADNREEWDIKNVGKLIEESKKMVQDTQTRMSKAALDLRDLVNAAKKQEALAEDEDLLKAEEVLGNANL